MNEEVLDSSGSADTGARPTVVTVAAIIYWVFAGIFLILALLAAVAVGAVETMADTAEVNGAQVTTTETGGLWAGLILAIITTAAAIFGTIKMWSMQKLGFFIFVGANAVSIVGTIIMSGFGVGVLFFPAIFIALFGSQLKNMR